MSGRSPMSLPQVRAQAELFSMPAFFAVSVILLCADKVAYGALDRWRLAAWEADWRTIEPQWSGRR